LVTLILGLFQNTIGWGSQIIGSIFIGYLYSYVLKTVKKTHNMTLKRDERR
jgi:hypothetical protein